MSNARLVTASTGSACIYAWEPSWMTDIALIILLCVRRPSGAKKNSTSKVMLSDLSHRRIYKKLGVYVASQICHILPYKNTEYLVFTKSSVLYGIMLPCMCQQISFVHE